MSIRTNFPSIRPTLLLDFANTKALDPRITFTRASTATYYGTQTAKAEENLLTYSQEFDNAVWGKDKGSLTANTTAAPDGTTTADTFTEDSTNDVHRINFGGTGAPAGVVTCSAFVKAGTGTRYPTVGIASGNSAYASATFDLSAGTNTQTLSAGYSGVSGSIQNVGGGWYRCILTVTTNAVANFYVALSDSSTFVNGYRGAQIYTGDSASSLIFWGAQLEQRSAVTAYTPTTTQPITNYVPVLQTAASGVARFDHNPTTGESLGLLIEESRTNLLVRSEEFNNAAWSKLRASVTANTIVSPDGTLDGDKLVEDTSDTTHFIYQNYTATNTTLTLTAYAKAAERTHIRLEISNFLNDAARATFNLLTGAITDVNSGAIDYTNVSATATAVGNGWYRCSLTATKGSANNQNQSVLNLHNGTSAFYTGNGYSGIYIWGAQLEAGAFPTSYIPTVASQVTRAADAASMTGVNFSSWYNLGEGGFVATYSRNSNKAPGNQIPFTVSDGTGNNVIAIADSANGVGDRVLITTNGAGQMNTGSINYTANQLIIRSIGYKVDDCATSANGDAVVTDTSALIPVVNQLTIGYAPYFSMSRVNGTIRKIAYYPVRVTNTQLQALTS